MPQQKKRGFPESDSHSSKKSRHHQWSGAAAERSNNFSAINRSSSAMPSNKKHKNKEPEGPYILEAMQGVSIKNMIVNPPAAANFQLWRKKLADSIIAKIGSLGAEINGVPYVLRKHMPEIPVIPANTNDIMQQIIISDYKAEKAAAIREQDELHDKRVQICSETISHLSEPLRLAITQKFPDFLNNPDVLQLTQGIYNTFAVSCYGGREQDMKQQLIAAYAEFFTGVFAYNNAARNEGIFNVHEHYKECINLLELRKANKLPDLSADEEVQLLMFGAETISHFRQPIAEMKDNYQQWDEMPKTTAAQRAKASEFRKMPSDITAAYNWLLRVKDYGIVYKDSIKDSVPVQRSTMSKYDNKEKHKKNPKPADSSTLEHKKDPCIVCGGKHPSHKCNKLTKFAEVIKKHEAEDAKKKKSGKVKQSSKANKIVESSDEESDEFSHFSELAYQNSAIRLDEYETHIKAMNGEQLVIPKQFVGQADGGCCLKSSEFKSKELTWDHSTERVNMQIQTTNGIRYLKNADFAMSRAFGKVLFNEEASVNLLSMSYLEQFYPCKYYRKHNLTLAIFVLLSPTTIELKFFRTTQGIFIGDLRPLLDFPKELSSPTIKYNINDNSTFKQSAAINVDYSIDPTQFHTEDLDKVNTLAMVKQDLDADDKQNYSSKEMKIFHNIKNSIHAKLGFMSPESYNTLVRTGGILNPPVPGPMLKKAFQVLGHNRAYIAGRSKASKAKPHVAPLIQSLVDNQILLEVDLMFVYELVFLLAVGYPGFYSVLAYIGYGIGAKAATAILPHLQYVFSVYKAMNKQIKFVVGDGEGGFGALATEINEYGGKWEPLPRHTHPCFADIKTKQIKEISRCILASVQHALPRKVLIGVFQTAVYFTNHTPCSGNIDKESPMMFMLGVPLNAKNHTQVGCLTHCEVKVEDITMRNTMEERTIQAVVLSPKGVDGWICYNPLTGKLLSTSDPIPRPHSVEVAKQLQLTRDEELIRLKIKSTSVIAAVQAKKSTDFRVRHFPSNLKKYGLFRVAEAMRKELDGLVVDKKVFLPVHESTLSSKDKERILKSGSLFSEKKGNVKHRFYIQGQGQGKFKNEFDYFNDIQSPTIQQTSINQMLVTAAQKGLALVTVDFNQAFGHAPQERVQFAIVDKWVSSFLVILYPERFKEYLRNDGTIVVKLNKALYGQIDAPKLFNKWLTQKLEEMDWIQNPIDQGLFNMDCEQLDPAIYNKKELATHVDDLLAIMHPTSVPEYLKLLQVKFPGVVLKIDTNVDENGQLDSNKEIEFLGMFIKINYTEHYAAKSPRKYYEKICSDYSDIIKGKTKKTPGDANFFTINEDSQVLTGELKERIETAMYRVRYPCHIALETTLYASFFITRIAAGLTEDDFKKFQYFLQYINGRIALATNIGTNRNNEFEYIIMSDASLGTPSRTGGVLSGGRGAIAMHSANQLLISLASAHAELYAASTNMTHALALQNLMESRGMPEQDFRPGMFYVDNMAVIHMMKNGRSINSKSKHIHIRYFFMKQHFDNGDFKLVHCPTDQMVADILTKPLQGSKFLGLRSKLLGHEYMLDE